MKWLNKRVALIHSGFGIEKEVSLITCKGVEKAFKELNIQYRVFEADSNLASELISYQPDSAFLATHGPFGEDGTLQGLLEYLKIPYTGSGVFSSALCMDKIIFKKWIDYYNIPLPSFVSITLKGNDVTFRKENKNPSKVLSINPSQKKWTIKELTSYISVPVVIKPRKSGSSIGVGICYHQDEFEKIINTAQKIDHHILIEEFIKGKEVAVSWLDENSLTPIEICPEKGHFYDYERKYNNPRTQYFVPARFSASVLDKLKDWTQTIFEISQMHSYGRVDYIIDESNNIFVLEANTLPGLTSQSLLPQSALYDKINYDQLILKILDQSNLNI